MTKSELSRELDEILGEAEDDQDRQHWMTPSAQKDLRKLVQMAAERQMEALNLYEPLPVQEKYHACTAKECLFSKGNQAGGSMTGFAEDARAVTGQDPYGKYPKQDGILVCLGYGEKHIGNVIHKYLCRWGAFEIIRDEETGIWRTYCPWPKDVIKIGKAGDLHRQEEARPAPPMVPKRFMKGEPVWTKKGARIFSNMFFTTGWELYAYNSQGEYEHAQGFQCDLWHIDEDVATDGWVSEAIARLSKRNGKLRWTVMPHAKTEDIVAMVKRAEEEEREGKENPRTVVIYSSIDGNPYLSDDVKEENKRIWRSMGDEEYERRVNGKLIIGGLRMYPQFDERLHNAVVKLSESEQLAEINGRKFRSKTQKVLTENDGVPPGDWCRYLSIDPGYTIAAGVKIAIPPPEKFGEWIVVYGEVYLPDCTASKFAEHLRKTDHDTQWYEFIFDFHGGKLRSLGSAEVPVEVWEKEFSSHGIVNQVRGSRMAPGSDDIQYRELVLREAMMTRQKGPAAGFPKLLIAMDQCPNLVRELKAFRKKVVRLAGRDIVKDEGERKMTHAVEALEQAVARGLEYHRPPRYSKVKSTIADSIKSLNDMMKSLRRSSEEDAIGGIVLGPRGSRD